jgi:hypothetical protein
MLFVYLHASTDDYNSSTLAGILRTIFLCVAYPLGRLTWGYISPPEAKLPLTLKVINPTFWVMMEMLLGIWAANLPTLAPLARTISNRYRAVKISSKISRSAPTDDDKQRIEMQTVVDKPFESWNESRKDSSAMSEQYLLV